MANLEELDGAFDDVKAVFEQVIADADLERSVTIDIVGDSKLKEIGKVVKASDVVQYYTEKTDSKVDVIVFVNHIIFKDLEPEQQIMAADSLIAGISFDSEKDKVNLAKCDVSVHSGILRKYGAEPYIRLHESVNSLLSTKQNKEDAGVKE